MLSDRLGAEEQIRNACKFGHETIRLSRPGNSNPEEDLEQQNKLLAGKLSPVAGATWGYRCRTFDSSTSPGTPIGHLQTADRRSDILEAPSLWALSHAVSRF